ncbi:hypothetical protein ACFW9N_39040 [Streptomyces sp. NPDC059496]|uniref:hypothetical protein n=1 Tax=Streptomyces sp. NPDC059496 TaxID=3346851 RepID=UPI0036C77438
MNTASRRKWDTATANNGQEQRKPHPHRHSPTTEGFDLLNAALRPLALNLAAADRLVAAIAEVLHENKVDLYLDQDTYL